MFERKIESRFWLFLYIRKRTDVLITGGFSSPLAVTVFPGLTIDLTPLIVRFMTSRSVKSIDPVRVRHFSDRLVKRRLAREVPQSYRTKIFSST